ncbi:hypothetical protein PF004_g3379 [Phytophthora fragariae]|uniref:Uncharacterized protein n=3 Tax=Phytophthora TaxID=4783 RepID=A0A6G0PM33_9STRA|nr:hypothetical protein PF004_g3379 [Phytophthora fragariae]
MKILDAGRNERGEDLKQSPRLQKNDESDIKLVVEELTVDQKFAKQGVDNELVAFRFKARKESQMEHTVREKELYEEQANMTHVLFIDQLRDHSVRSTEDDTHMNTKAKLTRCTDSFQTDTTQWISDMTPWFKHHAVWLGVHSPAVLTDIASNFIVHSYGIFH